MPDTGGIVLEAFDAIDDFVASLKDGSLHENNRQLHGSHALVLLVESTLEALSSVNLSVRIVGLSRPSEAMLADERLKLEDADIRHELQTFLYSFEPICQTVREGGYGSRDKEDGRRFFVDLFPEWLVRLEAWANDESLDDLEARVAEAHESYVEIADQIVSS